MSDARTAVPFSYRPRVDAALRAGDRETVEFPWSRAPHAWLGADDALARAARVPHVVDVLYGAISARDRLYPGGWGDASGITRLVATWPPPPASVELRWQTPRTERGLTVVDGTFDSPVVGLPAEARRATVRRLSGDRATRGTCLLLAGSREEGFDQRTAIHRSLVREGIDLVLLESPFYGSRRRRGQRTASPTTVYDHMLTSLGMVEEGRAILRALSTDRRAGPLAVGGFSMGGFMAALTAALTDLPVGVASVAGGASPAPVFTDGVLSWCVERRALVHEGETERLAQARLGAIFAKADVTHFPTPRKPSAAILVGCVRDAYVPAREVLRLHRHWPGSELRVVHSGHIPCLFTERRAFRGAVRDAVLRAG